MDGLHYEAVFSPASVKCDQCSRVISGRDAEAGYVRIMKGKYLLARVCSPECASAAEARFPDELDTTYPFGGRNGWPVQ